MDDCLLQTLSTQKLFSLLELPTPLSAPLQPQLSALVVTPENYRGSQPCRTVTITLGLMHASLRVFLIKGTQCSLFCAPSRRSGKSQPSNWMSLPVPVITMEGWSCPCKKTDPFVWADETQASE